MDAATDAGSGLRNGFWTLTRCRLVQLRNALDQQLREAPVRTFAVLVLLFIIWTALYGLLVLVMRQLSRWELVAIVANQHLFIHFFLVLAVMLVFSNAILAYGALFGRDEAPYLLASPVPPRHAICLKWLEGMLLSSWSFLLLGVPLMLAMSSTTEVEWYYYPLFIGHFFSFVLIPATLGLLVAWAVAMWAPRRPALVAFWFGLFVAVAGIVYAWNLLRGAAVSEQWLAKFFAHLAAAKQPLLPTTWTAKGIVAAMQQRAGDSALYLAAVLANGLFLAWLTINLLGRTWAEAYNRAHRGRALCLIRRGWVTGALCHLLFFYLPRTLRLLMLKDIRGLVRDARQWTQMVILLGLLAVYAVNLRRLPLDLENSAMRALLAFLNLLAASLILATFTSRFVFPLLSLETQQLWLLELFPTPRTATLLVKFLFSLTVTAGAALIVLGLSASALNLPWNWVELEMAAGLGVCIGLSGLAVGLGARFPTVGQRNPTRIASGFGGTFNLIASMLFVTAELGSIALVAIREARRYQVTVAEIEFTGFMVAGLFLLGCAVAAASLYLGARHFRQLEV